MNVTKAYAKALYEAAGENKSATDLAKASDELEVIFKSLVELFHANRDLRIVLAGPIATKKEKTEIIGEICKKLQAPELMVRFGALLASKGRLGLVEEITEQFRVVRLEAEGGVAGRLVSAEPITEADVNNLAAAFTKKLGKRIAFTVSTDADLLAGVKVTVNGVTYDGTLRAQLEKLRDQFVSAAAGQS